MPEIENFPEELLEEHSNWHMFPGQPERGGRAIDPFPPGATSPTPGSGVEFLVFHRHYIRQFHRWYDDQPNADQDAVAPWQGIPPRLRRAAAGWNPQHASEESRLLRSDFASVDELGSFIEWGIHGYLHGASARVFREPDLNDVMRAPLSTYFYKIHGLINHWWDLWRETHRPGGA